MTVETATYINQLNSSLPTAADMVSEGDDHIRLLKSTVKTTFPNVTGAVTASHTVLNYAVGVTSPIQGQIDSKGAIAGQVWSGAQNFTGATITVPTLAQANSTTGAASTAFVQTEWLTRIPNYSGPITASTTELNRLVGVTSGVQSQIDSKGAIAGQTWTGTHVFPNTTTVGPLNPTIQGYLSTATSDVQAQINARSLKAGDTYSGTHNFNSATVTVSTLPTGTTGNLAASVDFVNAASFSGALPGQAGSAGKGVTTDGTNASWAWFNAPLTVLITNTTPVTAVPGTFYIFTVAGARLNIPAGFVNGDTIGWGMSRGVASAEVNFGTYNCKGRSPGVMTMSNQNQTVMLRLRNSTDGFMEGA